MKREVDQLEILDLVSCAEDEWTNAQVDYIITMGEIAKDEREMPGKILLCLMGFWAFLIAAYVILAVTM